MDPVPQDYFPLPYKPQSSWKGTAILLTLLMSIPAVVNNFQIAAGVTGFAAAGRFTGSSYLPGRAVLERYCFGDRNTTRLKLRRYWAMPV
jgi:hypothetical protein